MPAPNRLSSIVAACSVALAVGTAARAAEPMPDLAAVVSYETEQVLPNGTVRNERWQERFVRRDGAVWTERVRPAGVPHRHGPSGHLSHQHFDYATAARLLRREADGAVRLDFVDGEERQLVHVPRGEWAAVSFDGVWDAAAHLVPPSLVAALPAERTTAEGRWHRQQAQGWTHRVLWSEKQRLALRIESARDDGSFKRTVQVRLQPGRAAAQPAPWTEPLRSYRQREYDDFLD